MTVFHVSSRGRLEVDSSIVDNMSTINLISLRDKISALWDMWKLRDRYKMHVRINVDEEPELKELYNRCPPDFANAISMLSREVMRRRQKEVEERPRLLGRKRRE